MIETRFGTSLAARNLLDEAELCSHRSRLGGRDEQEYGQSAALALAVTVAFWFIRL
jgi:hypothetical protein